MIYCFKNLKYCTSSHSTKISIVGFEMFIKFSKLKIACPEAEFDASFIALSAFSTLMPGFKCDSSSVFTGVNSLMSIRTVVLLL